MNSLDSAASWQSQMPSEFSSFDGGKEAANGMPAEFASFGGGQQSTYPSQPPLPQQSYQQPPLPPPPPQQQHQNLRQQSTMSMPAEFQHVTRHASNVSYASNTSYPPPPAAPTYGAPYPQSTGTAYPPPGPSGPGTAYPPPGPAGPGASYQQPAPAGYAQPAAPTYSGYPQQRAVSSPVDDVLDMIILHLEKSSVSG